MIFKLEKIDNNDEKHEKIIVKLICSVLNFVDFGLPDIIKTVNEECVNTNHSTTHNFWEVIQKEN